MSKLNFPQISNINETESLLFVNRDAAPFRCAFCFSSRLEPAAVKSGGLRIDVFYLKESSLMRGDGSFAADPICWTCVQKRPRGSERSQDEWRAATAGFLNTLHESDPNTYYCQIGGLG